MGNIVLEKRTENRTKTPVPGGGWIIVRPYHLRLVFGRSRFRANSLRLWRQHIDAEQSVHRQGYQSLLARLLQEGAAAPFTLPPEAVLDKVILALESRHPRARYRVTFPSRLFGVLQHLLPTRLMDALMARVSAGGRR